MKYQATITLFAASIVSLLGCSGDNPSTSNSASTKNMRVVAEAWCDSEQRCFPFGFREYESFEQCVERIMLVATTLLNQPGVSISLAQAEACASALRKGRCDEQLDLGNSPVCMIPGTLEDGKSCLSEYQCKSGYCSRRGDFECGVCKTPSREGEACDWDNDEYEYTGRECTRNLNCREGICERYSAQLGEACSDDWQNPMMCWNGARCSDDGICVALAKEGEACDNGWDCEPHLDCDQPSWDVPGVCGVPLVAKLGERCGDVALCEVGLYCHDSGSSDAVCTAFVKDFAPCNTEGAECREPFYCFPNDGSSGEGVCRNTMNLVTSCQ